MDNVVPSDSADLQRRKLALLAEQDREFAKQASDADAIEGAIANYETAFRMQSAIPEIADISGEPEHIRTLYGVDSSDDHQRYYASQALRARRLVEAGVRFVEITCPSFDGNNSPWDQHGKLKQNHEKNARRIARVYFQRRDASSARSPGVAWSTTTPEPAHRWNVSIVAHNGCLMGNIATFECVSWV